MDIKDIPEAIMLIAFIVGVAIFFAVWAIIAIVLSLYAAAYTVALLYILFIETVTFNTHSLFTIPYNEIWIMANMCPPLYWLVALTYLLGGMGTIGKSLGINLNNQR